MLLFLHLQSLVRLYTNLYNPSMQPNLRRGRQLATLSPGRATDIQTKVPVVAPKLSSTPTIHSATYTPQMPTITPTLAPLRLTATSPARNQVVAQTPTVAPKLGLTQSRSSSSPDPLGPLSRSSSPGFSLGLPSPHFTPGTTPLATPRLSRSHSMSKLPSLDIGSILLDIKSGDKSGHASNFGDKSGHASNPHTPHSEHVTPRLSSARLVATPSPDDFRRLVTQELEKVKTDRELTYKSHKSRENGQSKERRLTVDDPPRLDTTLQSSHVVKKDVKEAVTPPAGPTIIPPIKTVQNSPFTRRSQHLVVRQPEPETKVHAIIDKQNAAEVSKTIHIESKSSQNTTHPAPPEFLTKLIAEKQPAKVKEETTKEETTKEIKKPETSAVVTPKLSQHSKIGKPAVPELDLESIHSSNIEALEASLIAAKVLPKTPPKTPPTTPPTTPKTHATAKTAQFSNTTVTPVIKSKSTLIGRLEAQVAQTTTKTTKAVIAATPKTPKAPKTPKTPKTPKSSKLQSCTFDDDAHAGQDANNQISTEAVEKNPPLVGTDMSESELKERLRNFALVHPNDYHLMQDGDVITYINRNGKVVCDAVIRANKVTKNKLAPLWIVEIVSGFPKTFRYPMLYTNVQRLWKRVRMDTVVLAKCVDVTADDVTDMMEYLTQKFGQEFVDYIEYKRSLRGPRLQPGEPVTKPGEPTTPLAPPARPATPKSPKRYKSPRRGKSPGRSPRKSPGRKNMPRSPQAKNQSGVPKPVVNVTAEDL